MKQNLQKDVSTETEPEKTPKAETKTIYACGFCGKEFESKLGLKKHLPKCEASPDEPEPDEKESEPFKIFDDDEPEPEKAASTDEDYECGHCGAIFGKPYKHCPECGEELEWR